MELTFVIPAKAGISLPSGMDEEVRFQLSLE